jgi:hypothetical protein
MSDPSPLPTIAVLGGTGKEGKGLAYRWAKAGYRVIIGSRSEEKATAAASELIQLLDGAGTVTGRSNLQAAQEADIVVLAVPYSAHREILVSVAGAMEGKVLIDVTVPLVSGQAARVRMPAAGSAAQEAKQILGELAEVTAAFHNISHEHLFLQNAIDSDVLVTGTSKEARRETMKLVVAAGLTAWDAGALENSMVSEGLASVLIHINKKYGSTHAGIKITGVDPD